MLKHMGTQVGNHSTIVSHRMQKKGLSVATTLTLDQNKVVKNEARAAYEAVAFLSGLNRTKYQGMMNDMSNAYLTGRDDIFLTDVIAAYRPATEWKTNNPSAGRNLRTNDGVAFYHDGDEASCATIDELHNTQGLLLEKSGEPVECFVCKKNHLKKDCSI